MTQRSNHSPSRTTANAVAKAVVVASPQHAEAARIETTRIETLIVNVALASLILVVVVLLITTPTGAG